MLANGAILVAYAVALATLGHSAWTGAIGTATLLASAQALMQVEGLGMLGDMQTMVIRQRHCCSTSRTYPTTAVADSCLHADPSHRIGERRGLPRRAFTYPGRRVPTFDGLNLEIDPGTSVAVVGANGAGKSTLISCSAVCTVPTRASCGWTGATPARTTACGAGWR